MSSSQDQSCSSLYPHSTANQGIDQHYGPNDHLDNAFPQASPPTLIDSQQFVIAENSCPGYVHKLQFPMHTDTSGRDHRSGHYAADSSYQMDQQRAAHGGKSSIDTEKERKIQDIEHRIRRAAEHFSRGDVKAAKMQLSALAALGGPAAAALRTISHSLRAASATSRTASAATSASGFPEIEDRISLTGIFPTG